MTDKQILTTSGFILPDNQYFKILTKEDISDISIFNRTALLTTNSAMSTMAETNQIYYSPIASKAYLDYMSDNSFENYLRMVDITSEIFSNIGIDNF